MESNHSKQFEFDRFRHAIPVSERQSRHVVFQTQDEEVSEDGVVTARISSEAHQELKQQHDRPKERDDKHSDTSSYSSSSNSEGDDSQDPVRPNDIASPAPPAAVILGPLTFLGISINLNMLGFSSTFQQHQETYAY